MATAAQLTNALRRRRKPSDAVLRFLTAHAKAPGRAMTASKLAKVARYRGYRGINVQYGRLASALGRDLGEPTPSLAILVDFLRPRSISNKDWVLVMSPAFASALRRVGWIA